MNFRNEGDISEALEKLLDDALVAERSSQPRREYLGGSRLGHHCERALGYEYQGVMPDEGKGFAGRTYRIFDMGHDGEDRVAEYLRLAGFTLLIARQDGSQFGFGVAKDPDTGKARIAGHIDGVFTAGPLDIQYPCLWENKMLGAKSFSDLKRKGLETSKPVYYGQVQVYQAYMQLPNPALFTAANRDTGEIYAEIVPHNPSKAQALSDKGVRVISAKTPEELPRVARERTDYRCKFCDWQERCWEEPKTKTTEAQPFWLLGCAK